MTTDETCMAIQRAVAEYTRRTPPHLRDCDVLTGHIVRAIRDAAPQDSDAARAGPLQEGELEPAVAALRDDVLADVERRLHDMVNLQRASAWPHVEGVIRAERMVRELRAGVASERAGP